MTREQPTCTAACKMPADIAPFALATGHLSLHHAGWLAPHRPKTHLPQAAAANTGEN